MSGTWQTPLQVLLITGVLLSCAVGGKKSKPVAVNLSDGTEIRGTILRTQKGEKIYAFRGIPYAVPPIGELRFKPPAATTTKPDGPVDATTDGEPCVQFNKFTNKLEGQEDCLFLNVYSPELPDDDDDSDEDDDDDDDYHAVMVYIHGGAFAFGRGGSTEIGPGILLDGDVVLVTMNYRLGPLGFLSTSDEESPGNYGLMDQSLALKWVSDNIAAFGGDPEKITLFGESAGAVSVSYHLLSPMSSGLFQQAILMSGTALCNWWFQDDPLYWAEKLAKDVNCTTNNTDAMVDCLRDSDAKELMRISNEYMIAGINPIPFVPNLDGHFLQKEPRDALSSGNIVNKVPTISGVTRNEGATMVGGLKLTFPREDLTSAEFMTKYISYMLDDRGQADKTAELVLKHYLPMADAGNKQQLIDVFVEIITDGKYHTNHYEMVNFLTKAGIKTYAYSFDYSSHANTARLLRISENLGVGHLDDLFMLFDGQIFGSGTRTKKDKKITKTLRKLWTNFAKYGNPTPRRDSFLEEDWNPSTSGHVNIYHIDDPIAVTSDVTDEDETFHFWTVDVAESLLKEGEEKRNKKDEL